MQECGGSRLDDSAYAEQDKHEVEADDETVVAVDARHERSAELTQGDELIEIACRNGDVLRGGSQAHRPPLPQR